jgi:hypothetical protein
LLAQQAGGLDPSLQDGVVEGGGVGGSGWIGVEFDGDCDVQSSVGVVPSSMSTGPQQIP